MHIEDTERLCLEMMDANDADLLFELDQNPEVMRYINGGEMTTMKEIEKVMLPRLERFTNKSKGWGLWKVTVKQSHQFVGWILVRPMEFFSQAPEYDNLELGWRFKQEAWGKGYATEAALTIQQVMLKQLGVSAVSAIALEDNVGSINIMKKLGMSYVKTYLHQHDLLGEMNAVYYQRKA